MDVRITVNIFAPNASELRNKVAAVLVEKAWPDVRIRLIAYDMTPTVVVTQKDKEIIADIGAHVPDTFALIEHPPIPTTQEYNGVTIHELGAIIADVTQLPVDARLVRERTFVEPVEPGEPDDT